MLDWVNQKLPPDLAVGRTVLPMVLRRECMAACDCNLVSAGCAAVNSWMWCFRAWCMRCIEGRILRLGQTVAILVESHITPPVLVGQI